MESFKCPHCGNSTWAFSYSCAFCGEPVRTDEEKIKMINKNNRVCYWCGFINENSGNFCKNFGNPLTKDGVEIKEEMETTKKLYYYLKSLNNSEAKKFLSKLKKFGKKE